MSTLDILRLVSLIKKYKKEMRDAKKGDVIKGLDIMTFESEGNTWHLSLYLDCVKGRV